MNDVKMVKSALQSFAVEYGKLPPGDTPAIIRGLTYQNPGRIAFLDVDRQNLSWNGNLLDPWGSPYIIDLSDPDHPKVHSKGKNGIDEPNDALSDDICSWR